MHVAFRGNTRADIQELPDPRSHQPSDHPTKKRTIGIHDLPHSRKEPLSLFSGLPVNRKIVVPAQQVVICPRHVGYGHVHTLGHPIQ